MNGELDGALVAVKANNSSGADVEELRQQAKSTLLDAMSNGRLEEAMTDIRVPGETENTEALRQEVKGALLDAASDGRLQSQLADLKADADASPEELRVKAQKALLSASMDGRLSS